MSLRDDPSSIAPHRAIVFEIAGSVATFYKAAAKVPGLEFIAEENFAFEPDDDFAMLDDENLPAADQEVTGRLYLAMPNDGALEDILRLYRTCRRGRPLDRGFTPWRDLFACLKTMRAWGPQDRIPDDAVAVWRAEIADTDIQEVRVEGELFFRQTAADRAAALAGIEHAVGRTGRGGRHLRADTRPCSTAFRCRTMRFSRTASPSMTPIASRPWRWLASATMAPPWRP